MSTKPLAWVRMLLPFANAPALLPPDQRVDRDWTDGCAAISNARIEEIWSLVPVGTPIRIDP